MSTKGAQRQPPRGSERIGLYASTSFESVDFAKAREKRRRQRQLAKASRRKNRK